MIRAGLDIRAEAAELARIAADDRERNGDFHAALVIRDLEAKIRKIDLVEPRR